MKYFIAALMFLFCQTVSAIEDDGRIMFYVLPEQDPQGMYVRLRSTTSGTASVSLNSTQQEEIQ